jgi:uncharacterized protein (TIGR02265 family)
VVFGSGFEGLFSQGFRQRVTPALTAELKALGVDLDRPFDAAYPIETWAKTLEVCARHVYPELSWPDASWRLGRDTVDGFGHTLIGKAVYGVMKLIGPARSVERAARSYASTNNYTKVTLNRTSQTSYDFHINEQHSLPEFDMGALEGLLTFAGAKDPKVTLIRQDAEGYLFHLAWS